MLSLVSSQLFTGALTHVIVWVGAGTRTAAPPTRSRRPAVTSRRTVTWLVAQTVATTVALTGSLVRTVALTCPWVTPVAPTGLLTLAVATTVATTVVLTGHRVTTVAMTGLLTVTVVTTVVLTVPPTVVPRVPSLMAVALVVVRTLGLRWG